MHLGAGFTLRRVPAINAEEAAPMAELTL